eukprot:TRINITY_DN94653_c0_g1_i1.p1 TRINITY_DN94653_c0_g1~~TRINITY_DN94653_c0_g1_i1.p1  ORF type:complete len:178 (+),score=63.49 TRINITY_DN94653_c0_g1_i1:100-633(+)
MAAVFRFATATLCLFLIASATVEVFEEPALTDEDLLALMAEDCFDGNCGEDDLAALSLAQLRVTVKKESQQDEAEAKAKEEKAKKKVEVVGDTAYEAAMEQGAFDSALNDEDEEGVAFFQTSARVIQSSSDDKSNLMMAAVDANGELTTNYMTHDVMSPPSGKMFMTINSDGTTGWM